ncbi:hypothetical protein CVT26_006744 [Gymnopilus dilepis]|uniref:AB hydrolase-1 domain-containing protein n=1 Tax=Gymnopilus dilepis TaxID=231916 RepID=A0A409W1H8_9AGAR|nr:hypothetical protein CVT26_006744 [Gymnopilus dilepis]
MYTSLHLFGLLVLVLGLSGVLRATSQTGSEPFKPWEYEKKTAHCPAVRREPVREEMFIQLKYVDINPEASTTIIMVHGWPSLWSTWSHQIQEFKNDYHLIIPDLRGFGESTHPGDARPSGTLADMVGDLVCILEDAKVDTTICMGHDWGASICYEAARSRPDIFTAVVGAAVPYLPSTGSYTPVTRLLWHIPTLSYQVFLDTQPEAATAELDKDIRRTVRATLRTLDSPPPKGFLRSQKSFLAAWDGVETPPVPFFTPEEEDYFVQQYGIQGFRHTIQFYSTQNRLQSWEFVHSQGNHTIPHPVLAIYPTKDLVADWVMVAKAVKSAKFLPKLETLLLHGSHWIQLERPQEFNEAVREWLERLAGVEMEHLAQHEEL